MTSFIIHLINMVELLENMNIFRPRPSVGQNMLKLICTYQLFIIKRISLCTFHILKKAISQFLPNAIFLIAFLNPKVKC